MENGQGQSLTLVPGARSLLAQLEACPGKRAAGFAKIYPDANAGDSSAPAPLLLAALAVQNL